MMCEQRGMVVERLPDAGQWFERGVRVEYFPHERDPRRQAPGPERSGSRVYSRSRTPASAVRGPGRVSERRR